MAPLCFVDTETTGLDPVRHEIWEVAVILRRPPVEPDELTEEILRQAAAPIETPGSVLPVMIHTRPPEEELVWQLPVDLSVADPTALQIGRFYQRRDERFLRFERHQARLVPGVVYPTHGRHERGECGLEEWCQMFAALTVGAHMVGMVPSFDTERLERLLRAHGAAPAWHYQPVDVETVAVGWLNGRADHDGGQWKSWHDPGELAPPWDSEWLSAQVGVDPSKYERHSALGDCRWARDVWDAVQPAAWDNREETR